MNAAWKPERTWRVVTTFLLLLAGNIVSDAGMRGEVSAQSPPERYRAISELRVGSLDGPVALTRVEDIVVWGTRVLISQPAERGIRVLSGTSGEVLDEWGGQGQGPGEFGGIGWMGVIRDTLFVLDPRLRRITGFLEDGSVATTRPFAVPPPDPPFAFGGWVRLAGDGNVIHFGDILARTSDEPELLYEHPWVLASPDGTILDELPGTDMADRAVIIRGEDVSFSVVRPLHQGDRFAVAPDGSRFVRARDADGRGLTLTVYRTVEQQTETLVPGIPAVRLAQGTRDSVMAAHREEELARRSARARAALETLDAGERERAFMPPAWVPGADAMFVTNAGEVWLRRPEFTGAQDLWRVVGPGGAVIAEVEVPAGLLLHARDGNRVWGYRLDPDFGYAIVERLVLEPER